MSEVPVAFWLDDDYDREYASDGISRFGAYLRDGAFEPWTDDDQAVEWAMFAWQRATGPVMSPGYVRCHPRVLAAHVERSGWDGSMIASVSLACSWPGQLTATLSRPVSLAGRAVYWHDWPAESLGRDARFHEPGEADLAACPYALTTLSLQLTVPSADLPEPPATAGTRLGAARRAVAVVVAELNAIIGPALRALAGDTSPGGGAGW